MEHGVKKSGGWCVRTQKGPDTAAPKAIRIVVFLKILRYDKTVYTYNTLQPVAFKPTIE